MTVEKRHQENRRAWNEAAARCEQEIEADAVFSLLMRKDGS